MSILFVIAYLYAGVTIAVLQGFVVEATNTICNEHKPSRLPSLRIDTHVCWYWPVVLPAVLLAMYRVRRMR